VVGLLAPLAQDDFVLKLDTCVFPQRTRACVTGLGGARVATAGPDQRKKESRAFADIEILSGW
jgi:hypothetical protein